MSSLTTENLATDVRSLGQAVCDLAAVSWRVQAVCTRRTIASPITTTSCVLRWPQRSPANGLS